MHRSNFQSNATSLETFTISSYCFVKKAVNYLQRPQENCGKQKLPKLARNEEAGKDSDLKSHKALKHFFGTGFS
ncbi:hypothetical protein D5086_004141 [Populus alba]|uniref:Uncharacterized protein n=1 Tax=Populus alba TaxID=43335 RepID=A0ACC4CQD7_POPAL